MYFVGMKAQQGADKVMALTQMKLQVGGSIIDIDVDETANGRNKYSGRESDGGIGGNGSEKGYIDVEIL